MYTKHFSDYILLINSLHTSTTVFCIKKHKNQSGWRKFLFFLNLNSSREQKKSSQNIKKWKIYIKGLNKTNLSSVRIFSTLDCKLLSSKAWLVWHLIRDIWQLSRYFWQHLIQLSGPIPLALFQLLDSSFWRQTLASPNPFGNPISARILLMGSISEKHFKPATSHPLPSSSNKRICTSPHLVLRKELTS